MSDRPIGNADDRLQGGGRRSDGFSMRSPGSDHGIPGQLRLLILRIDPVKREHVDAEDLFLQLFGEDRPGARSGFPLRTGVDLRFRIGAAPRPIRIVPPLALLRLKA